MTIDGLKAVAGQLAKKKVKKKVTRASEGHKPDHVNVNVSEDVDSVGPPATVTKARGKAKSKKRSSKKAEIYNVRG